MNNVLIPDPLYSDLEYERFYHHDIVNMETSDLLNELYALRPLLWWELPSGDWLQTRVTKLENELRKRKRVQYD